MNLKMSIRQKKSKILVWRKNVHYLEVCEPHRQQIKLPELKHTTLAGN